MNEQIDIDPIWEQKYSSGHKEKYPWDLVVSFVFRYRPKYKPPLQTDVLEVGFGTGSNVWFAAREGFRVSGVEGSPSAVELAKQLLEHDNLFADIRLGTFTSLPFESDSYDLAIDRGSLVCVDKEKQKQAITEIRRCLRKGGRFLFNSYTDNHSSARKGKLLPDGRRVDIEGGSLTGVGSLTFLSRSDIESFFLDGWSILSLQRREYTEMLQTSGEMHTEWVVIAEKS